MELKKQMMPLYATVVVQMYDENPYEAAISETGLKLTNGEFENPDSGNRDKKEYMTAAGKIIETGPDCKYAHVGDDCLFDIRAVRPICFHGQYFFQIAEINIIALLGDDLDKRFKHD